MEVLVYGGTSLETKNLTHLPRGTDYWEKSIGSQLLIQTLHRVSQRLVQSCLSLVGVVLLQGPPKDRGRPGFSLNSSKEPWLSS